MSESIPGDLRSSCRMIKSAFPKGIEPNDYLALLSLLHDQFSHRGLAKTVAHCFGLDYYEALNDVAYVGSREYQPSEEAIGRVRNRLIPYGYFEWLREA